jgi:signal transduction histidine kinase
VADLQDYSRTLNPVTKKIDLEDLIGDLLLKNNVPKNIITSLHVEKDAKNVITDPDLLRRIICNLVTNAVQAMPNGGELSVNAYRETNMVVLIVEDTGAGISEEAKPKLFTPLFTTKAKGQGFGLAVVKRITETLGGTVTFESQNGKGTKFILRFPSPKK